MLILQTHPIKYLTLASIGLLARLLTTNTFKDTLRHRVEIVNPIGDWKRAHEAIHLWDSGLNPYDGNIFHEYPISLQFYKIISNYVNVDLAFCLTDVLTALLLHQSTYLQLKADHESHETSLKRSSLVYLLYLFSPLTIISCAGQSTTIFTNFLFTVILFTLPIRAFRVLTSVLCALLACNNVYYAALILPIFICIEYSSWNNTNCHDTSNNNNNNNDDDDGLGIKSSAKQQSTIDGSKKEKLGHNRQVQAHYYSNDNFISSLTSSAIVCLVSIVTLLVTSYILMGNSWTFIEASYLFTLRIADLTPNVGIYWYFFTEMFDYFLTFFTCIVQMVAFIQVIPLSIALRDKPFFALYMVALITIICQPYPSLASVGLVTSILPQYSDLFQHLSQGLKVACTCITCMSLWPIFWHLWIIMGTGNANFYFGATLAFMAALIFFSVDLLNAHVYKMTKMKLDQRNANNVVEEEKGC